MITTHNEQETHDFAMEFAKSIEPPTIILLEGDLGTGKTCFTRGLCEGLGGDPRQVSSPTFAIMQEYAIANKRRLVHIDAYRLAGEEELESIGWDEILEDPRTIVAIEWGSRVKNAIPSTAITIHLAHIDRTTREIRIN